jgi:hypothetical protein|tara:strand:- start:2221 stop:2331 length:111 start_codon:yes stop_codon:yes gene_type:complete
MTKLSKAQQKIARQTKPTNKINPNDFKKLKKKKAKK